MRCIVNLIMMGWLEGCRRGKKSGLWDGREISVVARLLLGLCLRQCKVGLRSRWNFKELSGRFLYITVHSGALDHCLDGLPRPSERRLRWQSWDG